MQICTKKIIINVSACIVVALTIKKARNHPKIFIAAQLLMCIIYFSGSHTVVEITIIATLHVCMHNEGFIKQLAVGTKIDRS